jgi:hypothetical protein
MNIKAPFKSSTLLFVFILSIVFSTVSCEDKKSNKSENIDKKAKQKDSIVEIPEEKPNHNYYHFPDNADIVHRLLQLENLGNPYKSLYNLMGY